MNFSQKLYGKLVQTLNLDSATVRKFRYDLITVLLGSNSNLFLKRSQNLNLLGFYGNFKSFLAENP